MLLGPNMIPRVSVSLSSHPALEIGPRTSLEHPWADSRAIGNLDGFEARWTLSCELVALAVAPESSTPSPALPPCRLQQLNVKFEPPRDPPSTTRAPAGFVLIIHLFPPSWECLTQLLPLSASTLGSPRHLPPLPPALLGLALTPTELCCQKKCQPLSLSESFPALSTEQGRSVLQRRTSHIIFSDSVPGEDRLWSLPLAMLWGQPG